MISLLALIGWMICAIYLFKESVSQQAPQRLSNIPDGQKRSLDDLLALPGPPQTMDDLLNITPPFQHGGEIEPAGTAQIAPESMQTQAQIVEVFDPLKEGATEVFDPIAEGAVAVGGEVTPFQVGGEVRNKEKRTFRRPQDVVLQDTFKRDVEHRELTSEFWFCCIASPVSFAGVWGIYWILCWVVLIVHRICKINNRQKQIMVLWLGIFIFVLMGLFPPVDRYRTFMGGRSSILGFLFDTSSKDIAFGKLFVMWFIVAAITGGLLYALKDKNGKRKNDEP
jgi:hypothetical protein